MSINLTHNLGGNISRQLETGTPFALPHAKVMNEVSHLVFLVFLFVSRLETRYWSNLGDKIFYPRTRHSPLFKHPPSLLGCLGGRTGTLFREGMTLEAATAINLLRCSKGNDRVLSSQRRLLGPKADCQFPTNHLGLGSLG